MGTAFLRPWPYFLALGGWVASKLFQSKAVFPGAKNALGHGTVAEGL